MNELLLSFTIKSFCPNELMFAGTVVSDFFIVYQGTCVLKARMKDIDEMSISSSPNNNKQQNQQPVSSGSNIVVQALQTRDYFGLEALVLFNQIRDARRQKQKNWLKDELLNVGKSLRESMVSVASADVDGDGDSDAEVVKHTAEDDEEAEELRARKKRRDDIDYHIIHHLNLKNKQCDIVRMRSLQFVQIRVDL